MITVWCVCVGTKYHPAYVYALRDAVRDNLSVEHEFKCITTQRLPGITTRNPPVSYQGWWSKIGLFAPQVATGPSLYFDLDVVITGNLDYLVPFTEGTFAAPANWAMSGHGGIQSSVMAWKGNWHLPYESFNYPVDSERLWGDQEFLWELLGDDWKKIPGVGSYKYHCRTNTSIPDWLKVAAFHGKPDPHEVTSGWMSQYTSTLRSRISATTDDGYRLASSATG